MSTTDAVPTSKGTPSAKQVAQSGLAMLGSFARLAGRAAADAAPRAKSAATVLVNKATQSDLVAVALGRATVTRLNESELKAQQVAKLKAQQAEIHRQLEALK